MADPTTEHAERIATLETCLKYVKSSLDKLSRRVTILTCVVAALAAAVLLGSQAVNLTSLLGLVRVLLGIAVAHP